MEELIQACLCGCERPAHGRRNGYRNACYIAYRTEHGKPPPRLCDDCGIVVKPGTVGNRPPRRCPECRATNRLRRHRTRTYAAHLRKRGGSLELVERLYVEQGGKCAICRCSVQRWTHDSDGGSAHLDHDHATGVARGLLCQQCNMGIGSLGDSAERLRAAADYLDRCCREAADPL